MRKDRESYVVAFQEVIIFDNHPCLVLAEDRNMSNRDFDNIVLLKCL